MSDESEVERAARPRSEEEHTDAHKDYQTILRQEIESGLQELERPRLGLLVSSLSAGLDLGFSVLAMAVAMTLFRGTFPAAVVDTVTALTYTIGFLFVIFGRSELFTEHTTLAFLPVLDGKASVGQLLSLWGVVYAGNLVGMALISAAIAWVAPALGAADVTAFGELAHRMTDHPGWVMLASAVLAGWLMGLLSWLVTAGRDTISQVFFVWLVTAAIGFAGLHHSILGTGEVLVGLYRGQDVSLADFGRFLFYATVGNALGGTIFVGLVKYSHARERGASRRFVRRR